MFDDVFPIYGKRAVLGALSSGRRHHFKEFLYLAAPKKADNERSRAIDLARSKKIPSREVDPRNLERWASGFNRHQGMVLLLSQPPSTLNFSDLIDLVKKREEAVLVALDQVQDHQNVGALARTSVCFGAMAILAPEERGAPLIDPVVWRIAQGAAEHIWFVPVPNLARALSELKKHNIWLFGAVPEGGSDPRSMDWPKRVCLVFGGEAKGLRRLTQDVCDFTVTVPQERPGALDSLNVSLAAAVLLWEVYRHRTKVPI